MNIPTQQFIETILLAILGIISAKIVEVGNEYD